ncbi:hypothetical protein Droror1_Dr00001675 [Drosera rotundifolia]
MESNVVSLPNPNHLAPQTLGFLSQHFKSAQDLCNVHNLFTDLSIQCAELETHLRNLHSKLSKSLVSWSSLSIRAKSSLQDFVEILAAMTSQYWNGDCWEREMEVKLTEELPYIAREVQRISDVREYAEITLKLESLVGDLEDSVLSILKGQTGASCSKAPLNGREFDAKQEIIHQAVSAIKNIEDVLCQVVKSHPRWSHLLKAVDSRVDKSVSLLRAQVLADHRSVLSSFGWPAELFTFKTLDRETSGMTNALVLIPSDKRESYSKNFLALSALQHVQIQQDKRRLNTSCKNEEEDCVLWAIEELVSPIASRIEHHLLKWITQPELMFALVYKIARDLIVMDDILQPLIDKANLASYSAKEALVSAMVKMLWSFLEKRVFVILAGKYKIKHTMGESTSSWLHLIDLIIAFDAQMSSLLSSNAYSLSTGTDSQRTVSVLSFFSDRPDWLQIWGKMELKDAWKKLKVELEVESFWVTDMKHKADSTTEILLASREDHKAPLIAESVLKFSWKMMQHCKTLRSSCRIQFIRSTSSKLLWKFLNVLLLRHDRIWLASNDSDEAIVEICALINAVKFCEFKLQEWSEEVDLLELSVAENGQKLDIRGNTVVNACFFDEEIRSMTEMQTSWLIEIAAHVLRQFEAFSFNYFLDMSQFEVVLTDIVHAPILESITSHDVAETLDNLRTLLLLIQQHLNPKDFLDLWRSTAEGLDHFMFRSVLKSNIRFSWEGVKQFIIDMHGVFLVYRAFCSRPEAFFPYISDLLKLLKLGREQVADLILSLLDNDKGAKCLAAHGAPHISTDDARMILMNKMFSLKPE